MPSEQTATAMRHGDFPGLLQASDLEPLRARTVSRRYQAGQVVFDAGDESDAVYVVVAGRIRIVRHSEDGDEVMLAFVERGDIIGEMGVLDDGVRSASAIAHVESELQEISRAVFFDFLEKTPALTLKLLRLLCRRQRRTIDQVGAIAFLGLEARLARLLVALADTYGVKRANGVLIDLKIGQRDLGAFIATTRESVGKQLNLWREEGLVEKESGRLLIRALDTLRERAGGDLDLG